MIKTILTILMISFITFANTQAQDVDTTSVNIRAILEKQIAEIRKKQEAEKVNIPLETKQQAGVVSAANIEINESVKEFLSKDIAVRLFVTVECLMLAGLILLWAVKMRKTKKRKIAVLKSNIKKLREEKIGSFEESNLSKIRAMLRFDPIKINDNGKDIAFRAKKNNISKGEVHLAAKIQLLAGEYK